jgi:hypothetical protein
MIPNRQSGAYALFARRPIVPQPPDVPAAEPTHSSPKCLRGAGKTKFDHLRETKDLSAIAHRAIPLIASSQAIERIPSELDVSLGGPLARRDNQEQRNRISFHERLW